MENNGTWYSPAKGTQEYVIREIVRNAVIYLPLTFMVFLGPAFLGMTLGIN